MHRFLFFLVFFLGCTSSPVPPAVSVAPQSLTIHADTEFTDAERRLIHSATTELMSQVSLRVEVIYDLDFSKVERLSRFAGEMQLMRIARDAQLTRDIDLRVRGIAFGWTITLPIARVYIVEDVLKGGENLYVHVLMHEFLHVVGCDHVSDPNAVLYWQTDLNHRAVRLTEADRVELKRAAESALTSSGGTTRQKH